MTDQAPSFGGEGGRGSPFRFFRTGPPIGTTSNPMASAVSRPCASTSSGVRSGRETDTSASDSSSAQDLNFASAPVHPPMRSRHSSSASCRHCSGSAETRASWACKLATCAARAEDWSSAEARSRCMRSATRRHESLSAVFVSSAESSVRAICRASTCGADPLPVRTCWRSCVSNRSRISAIDRASERGTSDISSILSRREAATPSPVRPPVFARGRAVLIPSLLRTLR